MPVRHRSCSPAESDHSCCASPTRWPRYTGEGMSPAPVSATRRRHVHRVRHCEDHTQTQSVTGLRGFDDFHKSLRQRPSPGACGSAGRSDSQVLRFALHGRQCPLPYRCLLSMDPTYVTFQASARLVGVIRVSGNDAPGTFAAGWGAHRPRGSGVTRAVPCRGRVLRTGHVRMPGTPHVALPRAQMRSQCPALWPPSTCRISPVTKGAFSR